jgi:hypothetical protein
MDNVRNLARLGIEKTMIRVLTRLSFLLVRHRPALERLQREIRTVVGDQERLTRAQISKLPYLRCVLNESKFGFNQIGKC